MLQFAYMNPALIEKIRDIPSEEIQRVMQAGGYSRWTYCTDAEAGEAGVIYANDNVLAIYHPGDTDKLELGPTGVMELQSLRYVPSAHQLYIVHSSHYLTLQVCSDVNLAGNDAAAAKQWQQFLAEHGVAQMTTAPQAQAGLMARIRQFFRGI